MRVLLYYRSNNIIHFNELPVCPGRIPYTLFHLTPGITGSNLMSIPLSMPTRTLLALFILISGGCVSAGTFDKKAAEADALNRELSELRREKTALLQKKDEQDAKQAQLVAEVNELTGRTRKLESEKKDLEEMLKAREDSLSQSLFTLRQQVSALTGTNDSLKNDLETLQKSRSDEVRKTSSNYEELLEIMKDVIARGQATVSEMTGTLTVTLFEPLLFDPGKAEVKSTAGPVLLKLATYFKGLKNREIRVEGYTETVLSATWSLQQYPTGWELAAARAVSVARALQGMGMSPLNLTAVSYGEYRPLSDNFTELGLARNRRIQLVVTTKE